MSTYAKYQTMFLLVLTVEPILSSAAYKLYLTILFALLCSCSLYSADALKGLEVAVLEYNNIVMADLVIHDEKLLEYNKSKSIKYKNIYVTFWRAADLNNMITGNKNQILSIYYLALSNEKEMSAFILKNKAHKIAKIQAKTKKDIYLVQKYHVIFLIKKTVKVCLLHPNLNQTKELCETCKMDLVEQESYE